MIVAISGDGDGLFGGHDVDAGGADGEDYGFDFVGGHEFLADGWVPCWVVPAAGFLVGFDGWVWC